MTPEPGERPKVLVVDDQAANLLAVGKILGKLPVEVLTARSGPEALSLLLRHEFAVILLDVRMPGMDGYETAGLIRTHTEKAPVPIIFVTAEASERTAVFQGYESGAVDYLLKPIDEVLLLSKLRVFLDLYEHRRALADATAELARSNLSLQRLLHAVGDGILGIEPDGRVAFVNPAACRILQCAPSQLLHFPARELFATVEEGVDPFERARAQGAYRQPSSVFNTLHGRQLPVEYVLSSVPTGHAGEPSYVLVFQDISSRLATEKMLRRLSEVDYLTGLSNRLMFEQRLGQMLGRPSGQNRPFALMLIDLDGFKDVNDRYGHAIGDALLKGVSQRLREQVRGSDLAARLGGDEFAVLLEGIHDPGDALHIGEKLAKVLSQPQQCGEHTVSVGASVGIALHPADGLEIEGLLKAADQAMYRAKRDAASAVELAGASVSGRAAG